MSHCHTVTLRDSSFSVQRVQLSSDSDNTAVAAVVARSSGVPCQDSPLTCAGVSAGCLLCIVTTLCHEPRYLRICHAVSHYVTLPLVTVTAVSRHCAPLRSPRTTGRGRPAQPTFYCTPHMSHVYTCTPHMSHVHCTYCTYVREY